MDCCISSVNVLGIDLDMQSLVKNILKASDNLRIGSPSVNSVVHHLDKLDKRFEELKPKKIVKYCDFLKQNQHAMLQIEDSKKMQFKNARIVENIIKKLAVSDKFWKDHCNVCNRVYMCNGKEGIVIEDLMEGCDFFQYMCQLLQYISQKDEENKNKSFEDTLVPIVVVVIDMIRKLNAIGIHHNDLHYANLFMKHSQNFRYVLDNKHNIFVDLQYVPVFIDFDWATINKEQQTLLRNVASSYIDLVATLLQFTNNLNPLRNCHGVQPDLNLMGSEVKEGLYRYIVNQCDFLAIHSSFSNLKTSIDLLQFMLYLVKFLSDVNGCNVIQKEMYPKLLHIFDLCYMNNFEINPSYDAVIEWYLGNTTQPMSQGTEDFKLSQDCPSINMCSQCSQMSTDVQGGMKGKRL